MTASREAAIETLAIRERYRDWYATHRDPIAEDRFLWRAQTFRHLVHLLPGERILELGRGCGTFTRQLAKVTRGENPICAVTFDAEARPAADEGAGGAVEGIRLEALPGALEGRTFDCIVGIDMLDARHTAWTLARAYDLLAPGGQLVFFESNPWNPVLRGWRALRRIVSRSDPRNLLNRTQLYELLSEVGFIRISAVFNDFVYAPLTPGMIWLLRNLSIVLENAPAVRTLAGSILVHAQKPPRERDRPVRSLAPHDTLKSAVSVVVPCHNEEMNVEPLVHRLLGLYGDYIHEIVMVDDNSVDRTADVIAACAARDARVRLVRRTPPNGVGLAIADGYRAVTGQWVLSMDCDFQHLLPEIRDLFDAAAAGNAVVLGSRFSRHSVLLNYPFTKILSNRAFHVVAQVLLLRRFRDVTNNLKLLRRDVVDRLILTHRGFAVNAEIGLQAALLADTVAEVPISWINREFDMGASSFRIVKSGGGYANVLWNAWRLRMFGSGRYAGLRPTRAEPAIAP